LLFLFFLLIVSLVEGSDVFNIQIIFFNWEKLMAHRSFCVLWVACGKVLVCKKMGFHYIILFLIIFSFIISDVCSLNIIDLLPVMFFFLLRLSLLSPKTHYSPHFYWYLKFSLFSFNFCIFFRFSFY